MYLLCVCVCKSGDPSTWENIPALIFSKEII